MPPTLLGAIGLGKDAGGGGRKDMAVDVVARLSGMIGGIFSLSAGRLKSITYDQKRAIFGAFATDRHQ